MKGWLIVLKIHCIEKEKTMDKKTLEESKRLIFLRYDRKKKKSISEKRERGC